MTISNWYKDTLDNLIDSLDLESLDWAGPIDEKFYNALMSKGNLVNFLKSGCLD